VYTAQLILGDAVGPAEIVWLSTRDLLIGTGVAQLLKYAVYLVLGQNAVGQYTLLSR
jgi:hypothetical protein